MSEEKREETSRKEKTSDRDMDPKESCSGSETRADRVQALYRRAMGTGGDKEQRQKLICPECQSEDLVFSKGNVILCQSCGKRIPTNINAARHPEQARALAKFLLSFVFEDLCQGTNAEAISSSETKEALAALKQAARLMEKLVEQKNDTNIEDILLLSFIEQMQSVLCWIEAGSPSARRKALELLLQALRLERKACSISQDPYSLFVQAWYLERACALNLELKRPRKVCQALREICDLYTKLARVFAQDPKLSRLAEINCQKDLLLLGQVAFEAGMPDRAEDAFVHLSELLQEDYEKRKISQKNLDALLFLIERYLARIYLELEEPGEAMTHESQAIRLEVQVNIEDLYEALLLFNLEIDKEQFMQDYQGLFKEGASFKAGIERRKGKLSQVKDGAQAIEILNLLVEFPQAAGQLEKELNPLLERDEALFHQKFEEKIEKAFASDNPKKEMDTLAIGSFCMNIAEHFHDKKQTEKFFHYGRKAIDLFERAEAELSQEEGAQGSLLRQNLLVPLYGRMVLRYSEDNQREKAREMAQKALKIARPLQKQGMLGEEEELVELFEEFADL